jgi:hypothetical protein
MPSEEKFTAETIKTLLGKPRLMPGESEESYQQLWDAFVKEHQPETLDEWLDVDQLAMKQWEQGRLRQCNTALIESAMWEALKNLLVDLYAGAGSPAGMSSTNEPARLARDCYFGNSDEKKRASAIIRALGINNEHVLAEALRMRAAGTISFDRMDHYRANSKRALRKNLQSSAGSKKKLLASQSISKMPVANVGSELMGQ